MTTQEMQDESKDHRLAIDWHNETEVVAASNMICSVLWRIGAEICERLDVIADSVRNPER